VETQRKRKNLLRARISRKRSWSWSWTVCPTRCAGCLCWHRVDGHTRPWRQATYSPFVFRFYNWLVGEFNRVWDWAVILSYRPAIC